VLSILYEYAKAHHLNDRAIVEGDSKNWWCLNPKRHLDAGSAMRGSPRVGTGERGELSPFTSDGEPREPSVNGGAAEPQLKQPSLIVFSSLEVAYRYVSRAEQTPLSGGVAAIPPIVSRAELPTTYEHVRTDDDFLSPGGTPVGLVISWPTRMSSPLRRTPSMATMASVAP
jgi:hypothetical protein|tara:strand:- start:15 stop:527 length:513 start_codon:yes stop_codon:yes gene_type:complete